MPADEAEPGSAAFRSGSGADLKPGAVCSDELGFIPHLFLQKSMGIRGLCPSLRAGRLWG